MRIALFVLILLTSLTASAHPTLDRYAECWVAKDLACMESLFTERGWKKRESTYTKAFGLSGPRELAYAELSQTRRLIPGRTIVVAAMHGTRGTKEVASVIGLELDRKGRIRKVREIRTLSAADADTYARRYPEIMRQMRMQQALTPLDLGFTACAVAKFGAGAEGNPITRVVFRNAGPVAGAAVVTLATDAWLRWGYEWSFWDGYGKIPSDKVHLALFALRSAIVVNNAAVCFG